MARKPKPGQCVRGVATVGGGWPEGPRWAKGDRIDGLVVVVSPGEIQIRERTTTRPGIVARHGATIVRCRKQR